ncbi:hypothetical protein FRC07_007691 [Ceratobasidium sp. 392]|nr:hypothetical protein FRC07_007691 [Ceratobasidium sp. 392]
MAAKGSRAGDPNDASSSKLSKQSNQCEGVTKDDPPRSEPEPSVVDEIVDLETWIPQDLSRAIRKKIREKLEKSRPKTEDPGYVYAFEIIDPDTPDEIHIKVGYSKDVARRLREWRGQCPSKKIVFRGCWPGDVESDKFYGQDGKLIGTIVPAKPTNYPRLIERLVHLELKEVAAKSLHLPLELRGPVKGMSKEPCLDCGKQHAEIFSFKRATTGQLKGNEFECVVLPVIIYWGVFVSKCFGDGPSALY